MRLAVIGIAVLLAVLAGCGSTPRSAPVADRTAETKKGGGKPPRTAEADWRPATHTVKKGETLYAIALEYGFDYRELAEINAISGPYLIKVGQTLRLRGQQTDPAVAAAPLKQTAPASEVKATENAPLVAASTGSQLKTQPKAGKVPYSVEAETAPVAVAAKPEAAPAKAVAGEEKAKPVEIRPAPAVSEEKKPAQSTGGDDDDPDWSWPTKGKLVVAFNEGANLKGVDIAGKMGQPVFAAAPGKVVYSGTGLRGYGKLVIIKHNKSYLSAYAHNSQILVKEGQSVTKGQRIAEMGDSDADQVKLHFEIRRLGKPVDPLKHLPETNG